MANDQRSVREIIVEVARGLFGKFGFKKTTMDGIAQAAYKSKSSIYHYFKDKEEIFKEVVEKESRVMRECLKKAVDGENTPQKKIRAYVITRLKTFTSLLNYYSALKEEYLEHYGFIEKIRKNHDKQEIAMIKEILKEGVRKGVFVVEDLEITAYAIIVALKGLEFSCIAEENIAKTEKNVNDLLKILFYGIVKRKG